MESPNFMTGISKQIKYILKIDKEPVLYSTHINEYVQYFKYNGYLILFLIECFIKKRNDDLKGETKKLREYISLENMIESFERYKKIQN